LTIVVKPSEHSRKTSPGRALKVSVSTFLGLLRGEPALPPELLDERVI